MCALSDTLILCASLTLTIGCQSEFGGSPEQREAPASPDVDVEIAYLLGPEALAREARDGVWTSRPAKPFSGALVHASITGPLEFAYSWERADGSFAEPEPLVFSAPEEVHRAAGIALPEVARALRLHVVGGRADSLDFLRVSFLPEVEPEAPVHFDDDQGALALSDRGRDSEAEVAHQALARSGRWRPSSAAQAAASGHGRIRHDRAPAWSRANCSRSFRPGARELAEYLVREFAGARTYDGYACRTIRGSGQMSMHGTGRAIDIFVPMHNRRADNDLGDPIANWLVENAEAIGVQYIIWDQSSWRASRGGDKTRLYRGASPHVDHLHIELNHDGAERRSDWFTTGGPDRSASNECASARLGRSFGLGECVQMPYAACDDRAKCNWVECTESGWTCTEAASCDSPNDVPAPACAATDAPPESEGRTCYSSTLDLEVLAGECVQMPHAACDDRARCNWAKCGDDGTWACTEPSQCVGQTAHEHAQCRGVNPIGSPDGGGRADAIDSTKESCYSRTAGRRIDHGACVQMNYASCGGETCNWAACDDGAWQCVDLAACGGKTYSHASCAAPSNDPCYSGRLGRQIDHGGCVQMPHSACGGTCRWAACDDGAWSCTDRAQCGGESVAAASCP